MHIQRIAIYILIISLSVGTCFSLWILLYTKQLHRQSQTYLPNHREQIQDKHTSSVHSTNCAQAPQRPSVLQPSTRSPHFLYIAHTLGLTPNGTAGTNTKEAFEHSYAKGFRLFEADLLRTKDNHIIVAHDRHEPFWGSSEAFEQTNYTTLIGAKYNNTYTTMDIRALLTVLQTYTDAYIILDIKFDSMEEYDDILSLIVKESIDILGEDETYTRLIPQIYTSEDIIRNPAICKFNDIIFTQYRNNMPWSEVLHFLRLHPKITAVAAPYPHRYRVEYQADLQRLDRALYVHPVRDDAVQTELIQQEVGVFSTVSTTLQ